ncbi:MAG: TonB-dependent receptor [Planctomycetes bacterium]|nr:TonB-dependent receptor [Planctomycetota bacterium]
MIPLSFASQSPNPPGAIRGVVRDSDFNVAMPGATVTLVEAGARVVTNDLGNFNFAQVPVGVYTLVFSKDGYARQVRADVIVRSGQLTDLDIALAGEFTDMDEFVVQDILQLGAGTEASLLRLRFDSPTLLDSIGSDLMSRAGAGDAAGGLRLVAGASIQDGKYAVIRGLPDRYVSSQMNSVRLPTADEDKRAVELDQFPAAVIESLQVSKTFTPDQQGDASGGAVNVRLKGIPDEASFQVKGQIGGNSQVTGRSDFLKFDAGPQRIQTDDLGANWIGAMGVTESGAPVDHKWSLSGGGRHVLDNGIKIGGFGSLFYERDSSFSSRGRDDSYWVVNPGDPMTPETIQGTPSDGDFKTALFDVTRASESLRWGGLGTFGIEGENHKFGLTYLYTRNEEDTATLAEDTRGKRYFFPNYDPNDPTGTGNEPADLNAAPYIRTETLEHEERTTQTLQFNGRHTLPVQEFVLGKVFKFQRPELDWSIAFSSADLDQPDKRQFGALWHAASFNPGFPPFLPPSTTPATWFPYKPAANFNLGNAQRIFKTIDEESTQYAVNLKLPFEQWSETEGYVKLGVFGDDVDRRFNQDTFSNFGDAGASFEGKFDQPWSAVFPSESHPISASEFDVDYSGSQDIQAWYGMMDLPLTPDLSINGGARFESIEIGIENRPEANATWFPPGATAPVALNPGDADVAFEQSDVLPAIGLLYKASDKVTLRASYSQTVARQTFKELTPILQQEFLGGPIFIGNPDLEMSTLQNYDLRVDYTPYEGGLVSASVFRKDIDQPIEYVQRLAAFNYTTPVNYPKGRLTGVELEVRQDLGRLWDELDGVTVGANGTLIDSRVTLPDEEAAEFASPGIAAPLTSREMSNAPEHIYNIFVTYDYAPTRTQVALFYTVQGDTLVAGAGQANGNFVPSVYAKEYGTLNLSLSQNLGKHVKLQLQAKNLLNPDIEEVYRSRYIGDDVTKTSYTKGIEYSLALTVSF